MGQLLTNKSGRKEVKVSINGLSGSGKKSILKKMEMKAEEMAVKDGTCTNIAGNTYRNITVLDWGTGGRASSRVMHQLFFSRHTDAMMIVVDSTAEEYFEHIYWSVALLLQEEFAKNMILLILANKQDLPEALPVEEVSKKINYEELSKSQVTNIIGCSAETGEGLQEAMDWLAAELKKKGKEEKIEETEQQGKKKKSWASCVKRSFQAVKAIVKSG